MNMVHNRLILRLTAAAAAALVLFAAGCSREPEKDEGPSESVSSSSSSKPAAKFNSAEPAEAAEANAKIKENNIKLVQFDQPKEGDDIAVIKTSVGDITVVLYPEYAPKAVENFLTHAKEGYYDNQKFYRVFNDFMIQSGSPTGDSSGGESIWKEPFEDEFSLNLWNFRGALTMSNTPGKPNTNGSQFLIVQASLLAEEIDKGMEESKYPQKVLDKYREVGGAPWLDGRNTVFGHVLEGMEVVDEIAAVEVDEDGNPLEEVTIYSIRGSKYKDGASDEVEDSSSGESETGDSSSKA